MTGSIVIDICIYVLVLGGILSATAEWRRARAERGSTDSRGSTPYPAAPASSHPTSSPGTAPQAFLYRKVHHQARIRGGVIAKLAGRTLEWRN